MKNFKFIFLFLIIIVFFMFISCNKNRETSYPLNRNDSINELIILCKKDTLSISKKKFFLDKAYKENDKLKDYKNKISNLSLISYQYYKFKDSIKFVNVNKEFFDLSNQMNDIYSLAFAHWNYANFYKRKENYKTSYFHFNKAHLFFEKVKEYSNSGIMLYGMAFIKGRYRDYTQAEILTIKAIKRFKKEKNYRRIYTSYNHLANLQKDIKEYDKAIHYYYIGLSYLEKIKKRRNNFITVYNNIANIYVEKKQYKEALKFYKKDLNKNISLNDYARVLNNRANCKLLMRDTLGIKEDFFIALNIRDSIRNKTGIISSKINISNYYKYINDTLNALKYAHEANILAKSIKNGGEYLKTLKQLANLDIKNSKKYLESYIVFNDSLISEERKAQNKFTRIEFETDEYIEEAEKLTQQNLLITISSIGTILVLSLLYFIRVQKVKNEKLRLEADQQKANEEVYVLTLQQQAKLEEERINERNRISAELHDGILGKLFGTRVSLGFLGMQMNTDTQEKHQNFLEELQVIEKEIRDVSHKLNDNFDDTTINFSSIIAQLLKDKSTIGGFVYKYTDDKTIVWKAIDEVTKANVYRIIQESLQNIIKHAKAKNFILDFSILDDNIIISLKDDGAGFNVEKSKKGIGLRNIKTRIKKLKGSLVLTSESNKGTSLHITIPYITNESKNL